jgi:hypothetical protein
LSTNPSDWVELTGGLLVAGGEPGSLAYEILAFMSQANAAPLGTKPLFGTPFGFANTDIGGLGLNLNPNSVYYVGTRANHSFQFNHDADATWQFWQQIKLETSFNATH